MYFAARVTYSLRRRTPNNQPPNKNTFIRYILIDQSHVDENGLENKHGSLAWCMIHKNMQDSVDFLVSFSVKAVPTFFGHFPANPLWQRNRKKVWLAPSKFAHFHPFHVEVGLLLFSVWPLLFSDVGFTKSSAGKQTRYLFKTFSFDMDIKLCSCASFRST